MKMFKPEELEKIQEEYYKIYDPFIETDYFSLLYDNSEEEWCYVISEDIKDYQLVKAKGYFLTLLIKLVGIDELYNKVKPFTISDYLDNTNNMMADKSLFKLYSKFNFMFPAFFG